MSQIKTDFDVRNGWHDITLQPWSVGKRFAVQTPSHKTFVRVASCKKVTICTDKIIDVNGKEYSSAEASSLQTAEQIFGLRQYNKNQDTTAHIVTFEKLCS